MTGNLLIDSAISLGGIAFIVLIAYFLFNRTKPVFTRENAAERLAFDEPDFNPVEWLDGNADGVWMAHNGAGEVALVWTMGDSLASRRYKAGELKLRHKDGVLSVAAPDHTAPTRKMSANADEAGKWMGIAAKGN